MLDRCSQFLNFALIPGPQQQQNNDKCSLLRIHRLGQTWQMAVITGCYANLTKSVNWYHGQGDTRPYLRQLVITSPVIQQRMEEPQTAVGMGLEAASHLAWTISTPHWWAPIRAKQLSVALPSFVGWLGRRSLVAANRTSCPPGHGISFTDLVRLA